MMVPRGEMGWSHKAAEQGTLLRLPTKTATRPRGTTIAFERHPTGLLAMICMKPA
jgi:hypothetical protein